MKRSSTFQIVDSVAYFAMRSSDDIQIDPDKIDFYGKRKG